MMRRMHEAGHHIASHSWTHRNQDEVNSTIQTTEIVYNEMAFRNLFGWIPTYFRPPYLACSAFSGCLDNLGALGYHVIDVNVDTKDYEYNTPETNQQAKDRFSELVSEDPTGTGYIVLAHDIHEQTVFNLTEYMVRTSLERGYRLVTVGECLSDPPDNWYRSVEGSSSSTRTTGTSTPVASASCSSKSPGSSGPPSPPEPTSGIVVSPDQTCGSTGYTCQGSSFGDCCSWYGFW